MGRVMILNGSPRAPKSNSKRYAEIFSKYCEDGADYFAISKNNHPEICARLSNYTDMLLVFPLYADSLPVGLLNFLKYLEDFPPEKKPVSRTSEKQERYRRGIGQCFRLGFR